MVDGLVGSIIRNWNGPMLITFQLDPPSLLLRICPSEARTYSVDGVTGSITMVRSPNMAFVGSPRLSAFQLSAPSVLLEILPLTVEAAYSVVGVIGSITRVAT